MKQTIKIFLLCLLLAVVSNCAKHETQIEVISEQSQNYAISLDEALQNLEKVLGWIDKPTRGSTRKISTITTLRKKDVWGHTTRSDATSTDNLLYIVNFEGEEGYAVLSADNRLDPVLLVADSGSVDPADYTVPEDIYLQDSIRPGSVEDPFVEYWCEEDEDHYIGNDGTPDIPSLLLGCTERVPIWVEDPKDGGNTPPSGNVSSDVPTPLLNTAWHQRAPFNNQIQRIPSDDDDFVPENETDNNPYTNNNRPAGCTTIAATQVIAYLGTQGVVDYDFELASTWSDITLTEEDRIGSDERLEIETDIANFVKQVADGIGVRYDYWGSGGTFATPNKLKRYLNNIGFDAKRTIGYETDIVTSNLRSGKPVIIGALGRHNDEKSGHAWVIDGFKYDESHNVSMVHCNMGWMAGNGWYANQVFSSYNEDNEYDDPDNEPTWNYSYTWWFRMVYVEDSLN